MQFHAPNVEVKYFVRTNSGLNWWIVRFILVLFSILWGGGAATDTVNTHTVCCILPLFARKRKKMMMMMSLFRWVVATQRVTTFLSIPLVSATIYPTSTIFPAICFCFVVEEFFPSSVIEKNMDSSAESKQRRLKMEKKKNDEISHTHRQREGGIRELLRHMWWWIFEWIMSCIRRNDSSDDSIGSLLSFVDGYKCVH